MSPLSTALLLAVVVLVTGCGTSRVIVSTGTTIGLKATPGDGNTRPPQVTFGYKRAEVSLVPTKGGVADAKTDAFSTLTAFHFETEFFGHTELDSFISTGLAAVEIQESSTFAREVGDAARADLTSFYNRSQLAAVRRITDKYKGLKDGDRRDRTRQKAEELGLLAPGTTDVQFEKGALQDKVVGGRPETTQKLEELERFTNAQKR